MLWASLSVLILCTHAALWIVLPCHLKKSWFTQLGEVYYKATRKALKAGGRQSLRVCGHGISVNYESWFEI